MKKMFYLGTISAVAAMFIGCGGGSSSSGSTSVSGTVEASYLAGVKVCVKGTDNCVVTDSNGKFKLNVAPPVNLEIRVGDSVVGDVNANSATLEITPAVLADNNETVAAYLGTMLHVIGGCKITDMQCDLGNIQKVDIDPNSDKPLVEELAEAVTQNPDVNVTVDGQKVEVDDNDVALYETVNPIMVGESELYYHGISSGEGFLKFVLDPKTLKLKYTVYNNLGTPVEEGDEQLVNVYKNVFFRFKNEPNEGAFISGGLAVGYYVEDNEVHYNIGLQYPERNLTAKDVEFFANKSYNSLFFDTDGTIEFSRVDLNTTNPADLNGTWSSSDGHSGTWVVEQSHIKFLENGDTVAIGFLRPGVSRAAIVYGDVTDGGFGIGLEAKPLTADELKGTFYYSDTEDNVTCFGYVNVNGTKFSYKDEMCTDNEPKSDEGTLELNPTVTIDGTNVKLNGLAKVDGEDEYVFIDPVDGYYISINMETHSLSIGSNKPLK
jgi:hypothetical protein